MRIKNIIRNIIRYITPHGLVILFVKIKNGTLKTPLNIIKIKKKNPKDYSTVEAAGSFVPAQLEAYFICLNKYVKTGDHVLDVGFGLGYGLNTLAIKASKISGVDVDQKVYDYCQKTLVGRNPKLEQLIVYDGYNLKFSDNHFDIISCVDVLEHVENYNKFLKELMRVAKRGIFISTPNRRSEFTNPDGTPKNQWHLREWSFEELNEIVSKFGKVEWNFINGPFEGPFNISSEVKINTLALSPFINKKKL